MKKRFPFLIFACLSGVMAHADTYPYLSFQKADGTVVSMDAESLTMTFSDGKLVVSNGSDAQTFTVAELSAMYFSAADATAIKDVSITASDGAVEAFDLQGVSLGKYSDIRSLKEKVKAGVYVVKANGKTRKITIK